MFARTFLQLFLLTTLVGQLYAAPLGDPLQVRHLSADSSAHSSGIYPRAKLLFHPGSRTPGAVTNAANKAKQRVRTVVGGVKNGLSKVTAPVRAGMSAVRSGAHKAVGTVKAAHAEAVKIHGGPAALEGEAGAGEAGEEGEEGEEPEE